MPLFEYKPVDKEYYEREIRGFLPARVIDVHTHVCKKEFRNPAYAGKRPGRSPAWPELIALENPIEDLEETYKLMFPGKSVIPVVFGSVSDAYIIEKNNEYIAGVARDKGFPALTVVRPRQSGDDIKKEIIENNYKGVKVYLEFAPQYIPGSEIRIFDFIPHHQLEVLNELKAALMLHIPRPGRLKDPVNIEQMLEIDRRYPDVRLIIAHVGRSYSINDVGDAFDRLKDSNMYFDFSANTNQQVFEELLKKVGPHRVMFGSDLPIVRMRMKRVDENGAYKNLIKKGSYGDVSNDPQMREIEGDEADKLSFFMYEIIAAMRRACETVGVSKKDADAMFYDNAAAVFRI